MTTKNPFVIIDICLIPHNVGTSLSPYVAACQTIFQNANLSYQLHPFGTVVEGDWDTVFEAVKACHLKVHELGAARISSTLKIGTRTDRTQTMSDKIASVQESLSSG